MKGFKRLLAAVISVTIMLSMFAGINASAALLVFDPDYDAMRDGWFTRTTEAELISEVDLNDGVHGEVIKVAQNYTNTLIATPDFDEALETGKYRFSFKFMSESVYPTAAGSFAKLNVRTRPIASYTDDTKLDSGWNYWHFCTTSAGEFTAYADSGSTMLDSKLTGAKDKTWYQVDCIYDLDAKTLKCYVDGQYIGAERVLSESGGNVINGFIIDVRQSEASGGARCNVYFDDITVKAVTGEGTFGVSYDEAKSTSTVKAIKFEEPVKAADVSGVKMYDAETLEEVAVKSVTQIDAVTVGLNINALSKEGAEYRIEVPGGIVSEWENTSEEAIVTFNTADGVEGGGLNVIPDTELFKDEFNYTDMNSALDIPTYDTTKWTNYINVPVAEGLGSYAKNNQLKTDFWNFSGAKSLKTVSIFEPQTSGEVDIIFDAAVNDQADSSVVSHMSVVAHTGDSYSNAANYSYFMAIDGSALKYSPDMGGGLGSTVPDLTLPNNLTDFKTYKINVNLDTQVAKLYIKDGSDFTELASMTVPAKFTTTGLNGFGLEWYKGGDVPEGTGSLIDNVQVIKKGYSTPDIGAEVTKPAVKKVRIDDGHTSRDVSCDSKTVKIYFNKPMQESTLSAISVTDDLGKAVEMTSAEYNADEYSYTMNISGNLKAGTTFTINVPTSVTDGDGKSLSSAYAGVFATGEGVFSAELYLNEGSVAATMQKLLSEIHLLQVL